MSVSVAMATYNGGAFVGAQLTSILRQSRPPDEIVVADDGSQDSTMEIVKRIAATSRSNVQVLTDGPGGVIDNFERAIAATTGDVVFLADQDDVWKPHKVEASLHVLEDDRNGAVFSDATLLVDGREDGSLWRAVGFDLRLQEMWTTCPLRVLVKRNVVTGATLSFRRDLAVDLLPLPRGGWHDLSLAALISARARVVAIPDVLILYRRHPAQAAGLDTRSLAARALTMPDWRENLDAQHGHWADLTARLEAMGATPDLVEIAGAKTTFLAERAAMPSRPIARLGSALRHLRQGDYHAYANGMASAARDLFLSGGERD